jgi:putative ABC transport system substrate-binding protein
LRRVFLCILALLLLAGPAFAYDVLVVQSLHNPAFDEVLRGFRSACPAEMRLIVLSDYAEVDVTRIVREDRPRLVVALGDGALKAAGKLRQTPVVALMTLGIRSGESPRRNLTGVDMFVPPERYLPLFAAFNARRIGVLYNPANTGWYVKRASDAVQRRGAELVIRVVHDPRESLGLLADLGGKVDSLWMIPDSTAVTRENLEAFFRFSQEQSVPLVSFIASQLGLGAAVVLDIDRTDLGRQAGEIASAILHGESPADIPIASPRKVAVKSNRAVLKNLGIPPDLFGPMSSDAR